MTGKGTSKNLPVVLVVDDDAAIRLLSRETLEQAGFDVIEAEDGRGAVSLFEEVHPDIILLDVTMPEMDGFTVCASVRRMPAGERVPVLIMTGLEDVESIHHAYNVGATDFITKPINWVLLGHRVQYILRASMAVDSLFRSEAKNRAILNAIPDMMVRIGKDGTCLEFKGGKGSDVWVSSGNVRGRKIYEIIPAQIAQRVMHNAGEATSTGEIQVFEFQLSMNGTTQDCEARVVVSGRDEALAIVRDITERKCAEEALRKSEERYALAAKAANDGLWDWDLKTNEVYYSPRWKSLVGFEEEEVRNSPQEWFSRIHPDDLDRLKLEISTHLEGITSRIEHKHRVRHRDGSYRWMLARGIAVRDGDGKAYRIAGSHTDITEQKQAEEQLLRDALYDALTNLPNRALLMDRLSHGLKRMRRTPGYVFALLFLDLDRFKVINDSLGHVIGDQLLIQIARRLESCLRPGDTVARLGGDEFVVLLDNIRDVHNAKLVADRIQGEMMAPFTLAGNKAFTTVSIGIAMSSDGYEKPEDIIRDADIAMYRAKSLGRARFEVFEQSMYVQAMAILQMETDLRDALQRKEFHIHYQPIVSLETGSVVSLEALLRWHHRERGLLLPCDFLPLAEETGMIIPIGEWVIRTVCSQIKTWQEEGLPPLRVSVNISALQFREKDFVEMVSQILKKTALESHCLELEITESTIIENTEFAKAVLYRLKALGIHLSLDDFGTGYSSLSYLQHFPLDSLKIDNSFINRLQSGAASIEIIQAIVSLGKGLGMEVIAEGVETEEQLIHLKSLNCQKGQGYIFARPLDQMEIRKVIEVMR
jgi:diguanylate cyclase (GGDEF)-like protein/PAS domain S-box-containing protein